MVALLLGLLHAVTTAQAAGFHFGRAEALVGWADGDDWSVGLGARLFSDAHQARIAFGDPATGPLVREAWLRSRPLGPVIGVVRPDFAEIVRPWRLPWLLPWTPVAIGGEAATRRRFTAELSHLRVLNLAALGGVDPRTAWLGPAVGVGGHVTGWSAPDRGWWGAGAGGRAGLGGGLTLRDSWYAEGHALARFDAFGTPAWGLRAAGATGVCFERLGLPLGIELAAEVDHGVHNATGALTTTPRARLSVWGQLAPPYRTRIEDRVEAATAAPAF